MTTLGMGRPVPPDFHTHAPVESSAALQKRYGCGCATVLRWRRETGIPTQFDSGHRKPRISAPDDFARRAARMTLSDLMRHYRKANSTIKRWLEEAGVEPLEYDKASHPPPPPRRGYGSLDARHRSRAVQDATRRLRGVQPRLGSIEERAAEHLRTYAPVYRCDATGKQLFDGFFWRYGNAILEPQDLIDRAKRRGFDPDEWCRL